MKKLAQEYGLRRSDNSGKPVVTLNQAMRKNRLELWYQPKIDLATKRLVGAEVEPRRSMHRYRQPLLREPGELEHLPPPPRRATAAASSAR